MLKHKWLEYDKRQALAEGPKPGHIFLFICCLPGSAADAQAKQPGQGAYKLLIASATVKHKSSSWRCQLLQQES